MKLLSAILFGTLLQSGAGATDLDARVQALATAFPGEIGVFAKNLNTGQTIAINADTRFPTASVIKLAVLVEAFHQIAEGKLSPGTKVTLRESDKVGIGDSGTVNELHDGTELTVSDLLNLMIVVSDNTATNLIVGRLGTAAVNARMESYGLRQ